MARVPFVEEQDRPDLHELMSRIKEQRGSLHPLYKLLLHSPPMADGWLRLLTAVRQQASLDARIRELVILHVAVLNGADYEYRSHVPLALAEGMSQAQIDALPSWREADVFDARERAVLGLCEAMTRAVHVSDETFAAVRDHFNAQEQIELTVTVASYNMVSRFLEAMDYHG